MTDLSLDGQQAINRTDTLKYDNTNEYVNISISHCTRVWCSDQTIKVVYFARFIFIFFSISSMILHFSSAISNVKKTAATTGFHKTSNGIVEIYNIDFFSISLLKCRTISSIRLPTLFYVSLTHLYAYKYAIRYQFFFQFDILNAFK